MVISAGSLAGGIYVLRLEIREGKRVLGRRNMKAAVLR
jgi:hypothetical protein